MAGGWGNEWYFGYQHAHSDLSLEDFRSRDRWWDYCRYALEFFKNYEIPFWEMSCTDELVSGPQNYCLCKPGQIYVVYLKRGAESKLDLSNGSGAFEVAWYNPREGGSLQRGSVRAIHGGSTCNLGNPPADADQDWVVLVRPADPNRNYPPGVRAGDDQTVMLPRDGNSITVRLHGTVTDDGKPDDNLTTSWGKHGGPGSVRFDNVNATATSATLTGAGVHVLKLTASDGQLTADDTVAITVEPYSTRVTKAFPAVAAAFIEGGKAHNTQHLKVEPKRRVSYLKFEVTGLPAKVTRATLKLTQSGDTGGGTLRVHRGAHNDWTESKLSPAGAPAPQKQVGTATGRVGAGETIEIDVTPLVSGNGTYTVVITLDQGGNDIWFESNSGSHKPELVVTAQDPSGG
jgi:hypothetical protein